jgi:hypothetical protein
VLVVMLGQMSGLRNGKPWPPRGHTMELPEDEALPLLEQQMVLPATDPDTGVELAVRDLTNVEERQAAREALVPARRAAKTAK